MVWERVNIHFKMYVSNVRTLMMQKSMHNKEAQCKQRNNLNHRLASQRKLYPIHTNKTCLVKHSLIKLGLTKHV